MANQGDRDKHETLGGVSPRDRPDAPAQRDADPSYDLEHGGTFGPSPVPESPSWAQLSGSIAPTAQPATASEPSHAVRSATIASSFVLGALVTAALAAMLLSAGPPLPRSAAARFGAPEPPVDSPVQVQPPVGRATSVVAELTPVSWKQYSGTFGTFDMAEAEGALAESRLRAQSCFPALASSSLEVEVVFGQSGRVASARILEDDRVEESLVRCVTSRFREAVVSPFEGREVKLVRRLSIQR